MENEKNLTFGEKLKTARKSAGLTQEQLAENLTVSRQAVTKWESDRGLPDIENLRQIARLMNVSLDYLLDSGEAPDMSVLKEELHLGVGLSQRKAFWPASKRAAARAKS